MRDDNRATIELFEARKRIAELEMLNREHLKTIARDDARLAELHDAKVSAGKDNNAYAKRILEQDRRIAELEAERDRLRKALQEAKYQINHSQDTDYIIYHIDKALEIE